MTKIKLCGLSRPCDIEAANQLLPEYIGFVFAPKSKRYVTYERALALKQLLAPSIQAVGVFVNERPETVAKLLNDGIIDIAQLHGDETSEQMAQLRKLCPQVHLWRAVRVQSRNDLIQADQLGADALVLDSYHPAQYGGTGRIGDWDLISSILISTPFFLAGGLNADNLEQAIHMVRPMGVDLSGGVETGGVKDQEKILQAVALAHRL